MKITHQSIEAFLKTLSSESPAPGGGSVAALAGCLSVALCTMVSQLTLKSEKYSKSWNTMNECLSKTRILITQMTALVDKDTDAYMRVMHAFKMPKGTSIQKTDRKKAIERATIDAAAVPLETLQTISELTGVLKKLVAEGNPNCITDTGVAAQMARAGALGAVYNVRINLFGISDETLVKQFESQSNNLVSLITHDTDQVDIAVNKALSLD